MAPSRTGARDATRSTSADSIGLKGFSSLGARFAILLRRSDLRLLFLQLRETLLDLSRQFPVLLRDLMPRFGLENRLPHLLGLGDDNGPADLGPEFQTISARQRERLLHVIRQNSSQPGVPGDAGKNNA